MAIEPVTESFTSHVYRRMHQMEQEYDWRPGQAAYNALHSIEPEIADLIRGSLKDPFYDDSRLPDFWAELATWE